MPTDRAVGAIDLGGTHVTAARVDPVRWRLVPGSLRRRGFEPDVDRDALLDAILGGAAEAGLAGRGGIGVAVPGPFDYERGICTIAGVGKLDALFGVNLREALSARLGVPAERIRFLNDADAFLLGEWRSGAARGHRRAIGITLGTGLGSAFLVDGRIVESGPGVPDEGRLDLVPFRGGPVEDVISRRGLLVAYGLEPGVDVAQIAERARQGDPRAAAVLAAFGTALGEFLAPWIDAFGPSCVVIGGSISGAWDRFAPFAVAACPPAAQLDRWVASADAQAAALIGGAHHAAEGA